MQVDRPLPLLIIITVLYVAAAAGLKGRGRWHLVSLTTATCLLRERLYKKCGRGRSGAHLLHPS